MGLEHANQRCVRLDRTGNDQKASGVLIKPMDDASAGQLREVGIEVQERVLKRAAGIPGAWMYDQTGGLVDHEQVSILEGNLKVDDLRRNRDRIGQYGVDLDPLTADDLVFRSKLPSIHKHLPGLDPGLDPGSGILRKQLRQDLVETLTGSFGRNRQRELNRVSHG
jgi:hypothetical protein